LMFFFEKKNQEIFDGCRSDALSFGQTLEPVPRSFTKRDVRV